MTNNEEQPLYASVTEEGDLHFGWIHGPQGSLEQKRLDIYACATGDDGKSPEMYAIRVGPGHVNEIIPISSSAQVLEIIKDYLAVPFNNSVKGSCKNSGAGRCNKEGGCLGFDCEERDLEST